MKTVPTAEQLLADATWLRRLALTLATDRDEADDLVQESWIAAWKRGPSPDRSLRPWFAKVMRDVAAMRRRSRLRREAREQVSAEHEDEAAPDTVLAQMRLHQLIVQLVLELEEPYRATILARFVEGRTAAAIARSLGIPASTVRARQHEGLARLRARLDEHTGERKAWAPAVLAFAHRTAATTAPSRWLLVAMTLLMFGITAAIALPRVVGDARQEPQGGKRSSSSHHASATVAMRSTTPSTVAPAWMSQTGVAPRRIAGRVVYEGAPVAGALVRLTSEATRAGVHPASEQRTDGEGRFDFGQHSAATYAIGAAMPGKRAAIEHVDLRDPRARAEAIELALRACDAALVGRVLDPAGGPIAHAQVLREDVIGAETDAVGAFELCVQPTGLTMGQLRISIRAPGYAGLQLAMGLTGRLVRDFVLVPEATLEGIVISPAGVPAADVEVEVQEESAVFREGVELPAPAAALTDQAGRFRITGVAGGSQRVTAHGRQGIATPVFVSTKGGESQSVTLRLVSAGSLAGRVLLDNEPIAGVTVAVDGEGASESVTQADGTFVLDQLAPGTVHVITSPYRARDASTTIRPGERAQITIEVVPTGEVRGIVRRQGVPAAGARVMVARLDESSYHGAYTDEAGRFAFDAVDPGDYHGLAVTADERALASPSFSIRAGERRELEIELTAGARVTGTVVDGMNLPVPDVSVHFDRPGASEHDAGRCRTDARGHFECGCMAGGGSYTASVFAFDNAQPALQLLPTSATAADLADGASRVDGITLVVDGRRVAIRGRVLDSAGAPVADVRVTAAAGVAHNHGLIPSTVTTSDGAFVLADLAPGA